VLFVVALAIVLTGVDVMMLVELAILFSILVLPLTYLPLLLLSGDRQYMGQYANGPVAKMLGWFYFALIVVAAVAAVPLFILTSGGNG
jgi:Mn2+/Fe2+ NRAMP family transporter